MGDIRKELTGNILGAPRAENDLKMLENAFIETADYSALTRTRDFNFVVGRRGTGKSALFMKVSEYFDDEGNMLLKSRPKEYDALEYLSVLEVMPDDYRAIRSISRIAWRAGILITILNTISSYYKYNKSGDHDYLSNYIRRHGDLLKINVFKCCCEIVKKALSQSDNFKEVPGIIANSMDIENLQRALQNTLLFYKRKVFYLFDGLDEGWLPNQKSTAILGGLGSAASDLSDSMEDVHLIIFIRDNIFRSLAVFDPDFARNIEGYTLRLRWDEASLFNLVSNRLRFSLGLERVESDVKVWNRFAQRELKERDGFKSCLKYTLFRPRDLLVLLNSAFQVAAKEGRSEIVGKDIESTSMQISKERISDLIKEYEVVFPGLNLFIELFRGKSAFNTFQSITSFIDTEIEINPYETPPASDFALLGSGSEIFFALYSIGFIGLEDPHSGNLFFCHDGSRANIDAINLEQRTCIHPCYWKGLDIKQAAIGEDTLNEIYDDFHIKNGNSDLSDLRTKNIGQLITELPKMPLGSDGAKFFEQWVFRTIKILFSGQLQNPEMKPNKDAVQRRDIVATSMAQNGFWQRVRQDYQSRQIIFEVKNYSDLKPEDFRQALSYTTPEYGNFIVIVHRSENEGVSDTDRGWIKDIWDGHKRLIFIVPAILLSRCVGKLRNPNRFNYTDDVFNKRLDTYVRSYLALTHSRKTKTKKR